MLTARSNTVSFTATDLAGNPATSVSNAQVYYTAGYDAAHPWNVDNAGTSENRVDNADMIMVLDAYGSKSGDPVWNPVYDLDKNNKSTATTC